MSSNSPTPDPERLERVKEVLAESFPQVPAHAQESLPESVLRELGVSERESARSAKPAPSESFLDRLLQWMRGPQALGAGAVALLLIGVLVFLPAREEGGGGDPVVPGDGGAGRVLRSPVKKVTGPSMIVFHGVLAERVQEIVDSEIFRPEHMVTVEEGADLEAVLTEHRRLNLVLVDGTVGEVSLPFYSGDDLKPIALTPELELLDEVLRFLAKLPPPEGE